MKHIQVDSGMNGNRPTLKLVTFSGEAVRMCGDFRTFARDYRKYIYENDGLCNRTFPWILYAGNGC